MELSLIGRTVTQSIGLLRDALASCEDGNLIVKTDNETVKLNLYNQTHRLGLSCRAERQGPYYILHVKLAKAKQPKESTPTGVKTANLETTAFPLAHLGSSAQAPATPKAPAKKRRRSLVPHERQPVPTIKPRETPAQPARPTVPAQAPQEVTAPRMKWLVLQTDQIGNRDTALGIDLMEDLLDNLNVQQFAGAFLVHRGVRLLDPNYANGRLLRCLLRKNLKINVCQRSVAFYQLTDRIPNQASPFSDVLKLANIYDLVWI